MKNTLAENMLRFGVKNLSESEIKKIAEQAAQVQKEFNEAESFENAFNRGEIKIGVSKPQDGFHTKEPQPGMAIFYREPVVLWDGSLGLIYSKITRTKWDDTIPDDPETPAYKKWYADVEAKLNASTPSISVIKLVGNNVQFDPQIKVKPVEYSVLTFCAQNMDPKSFQNGQGKSFVELTQGGIKPNVTPETYNKKRLIDEINAGKFGPNAKNKAKALETGFKIV
jgi:hypothetical protein